MSILLYCKQLEEVIEIYQWKPLLTLRILLLEIRVEITTVLLIEKTI
nr:MAG TPA: hypothetical protein [Caudoviricetes sp.]